MALIRPSLNKIPAFDAFVGTTLNFSWTGGQAKKNRIIIREYDTQKKVYDCKETTMALRHTLHLPITKDIDGSYVQEVPYALKNGERYVATVIVYDMYDMESLASNEVNFYCFATPVIEFTNFDRFDEKTGIAKVSYNSIYLNVHYQQKDGEVLNEYGFILYDYNGNKLLQSGNYYGSTNDDYLQYTLGGITDTEKDANGNLRYDRYYCIEFIGTTTHGMEVNRKQKFVVQKDVGGVGALIRVEKSFDNNVIISSNFKIVNSSLDGKEKYLKDSEDKPYAIDLAEGQKLRYFDSFSMKKPWYITAIVSRCNSNQTLIRAWNASGEEFSITYNVRRYSKSKKAFFLFEEKRGSNRTLLKSDDLPITDKWYIIFLKCENGYYTFKIYDPEEVGYEVEPIEDALVPNPNDLFKKFEVKSMDFDKLGTSVLSFNAEFDLSGQYNFEPGKRYRITFDAKNIIKNNFRYLILEDSSDFTVTSNAKRTIKTGKESYMLDFYSTDEMIAPTVTATWTHVCNVTKQMDYIKSYTYCVLSDLYIDQYHMTYGELEQYTHEFLSNYTYGELETPGIDEDKEVV